MKKMTTSAVPLGVVLLLVVGALARDSREDRSPGVTATNRGAVTLASIDFFERRLREHPGSFTTANALVDRYLLRFQERGRLVDLRRAEEVARRVTTLMSWDAGPHARLSAILLRQHRVLEAEREARIAARMDGKRADPVLFDALLERGLYDEVEAVLGRMDPRTFAYNVRYARLQEMMGNLDGSTLAMSRACRTLSGAGVAGAMMAWCYTELSGLEWSAGNLRRSRDLHRPLRCAPATRADRRASR